MQLELGRNGYSSLMVRRIDGDGHIPSEWLSAMRSVSGEGIVERQTSGDIAVIWTSPSTPEEKGRVRYTLQQLYSVLQSGNTLQLLVSPGRTQYSTVDEWLNA